MGDTILPPGWRKPDKTTLPDGWRNVQVHAITKTVAGGRLGLTKEKDYCSSGVPAFSAAGQDGYVSTAEFIETDAVILSSVGANCGRCFLAEGSWTTLANVQAIVTHKDVIARWLHYRVNHGEFWPRSGSAQPFIKPSDIGRCWLAMPPVPEQRLIAEILDTVDEAIRKTEAIIAKLGQVKQGLLHDLLTRGIDDNGQLRDPDRHPEQFKDSPLGRIPKEWEVEPLGTLTDPRRPIVYGILMPGRGHQDGVPVVKVKDIKAGKIQLDDLLLTSPAIDREYRRSRLEPGDLVFTIRGTVGRMAFVPRQLDQANITQDTARISLVRGEPTLVREYLGMPGPRRFIDTHTIGVAVRGINLRDVRKIPIAVPPSHEAQEISPRLNAVSDRIVTEREEVTKLRLLKLGLMDDLLTGRVRVTNLLQEAST